MDHAVVLAISRGCIVGTGSMLVAAMVSVTFAAWTFQHGIQTQCAELQDAGEGVHMLQVRNQGVYCVTS